MAGDFENVYNLDDMSDEEIRDLIAQKLDEGDDWDAELISISVDNGHVYLDGRVGTEQELAQIEQIVTDVIGITDATNDIVVDELVRGERSEAADVAAAEDARATPVLGDGEHRSSDTADHLMSKTEGDQYGTSNPKEAIERGLSYNPPEGPTSDGIHSRESH